MIVNPSDLPRAPECVIQPPPESKRVIVKRPGLLVSLPGRRGCTWEPLALCDWAPADYRHPCNGPADWYWLHAIACNLWKTGAKPCRYAGGWGWRARIGWVADEPGNPLLGLSSAWIACDWMGAFEYAAAGLVPAEAI